MSRFVVPSLLLLRDTVERLPPALFPLTVAGSEATSGIVTSYVGVLGTTDSTR